MRQRVYSDFLLDPAPVKITIFSKALLEDTFAGRCLWVAEDQGYKVRATSLASHALAPIQMASIAWLALIDWGSACGASGSAIGVS